MWRSLVRAPRTSRVSSVRCRFVASVLSHRPALHSTRARAAAAAVASNSAPASAAAALPSAATTALPSASAVPAAAGDGWRSEWRAVWNAPPEANTGSVARDHLANERTFLAWSRTGLAFVGVGIGLNMGLSHEQLIELVPGLFLFQTQLPVLCFIGTGACFVAYATARYVRIARLLQRGLYAVNTSGIVLVVAVSGAIVLAGLALLIAHPRHSPAAAAAARAGFRITIGPAASPDAPAAPAARAAPATPAATTAATCSAPRTAAHAVPVSASTAAA